MTIRQEHREHTADWPYRDTCAICRFETEQARAAARDAKLDALLAGGSPAPEVEHGIGWCPRCESYCYGDCRS